MTDKKKLEDVMQKRNPLKRDIVQPVDIYTSQQVDKPESNEFELPVAPQTISAADTQVVKEEDTRSNKSAANQKHRIDGVLIRKYTTHLPPSMIKAIKQRALDTDRKDYEVMFEAISRYFAED
jgi:hypothetical protein